MAVVDGIDEYDENGKPRKDIKTCKVCGKKFRADWWRQTTCRDCIDKGKGSKSDLLHRDRNPRLKAKLLKAAKLGMSYGKYCALMKLKEAKS